MKVIHLVLGKANPQRMNGVNKVVHELASAQHTNGNLVEVWGITADPQAPVAERAFPTRLFGKPSGPFRFDPELLVALEKETQDTVVHLHGGFIPVYSTLGKEFNRRDIPYILTAHGAYNTIAMRNSKWKKRGYFLLAERRLLRQAKAVHCIGQSELDALARLLPAAHGVLIPNGQHLPEYQAHQPGESTELRIGFCGRLRAHTKGLDILLKAFAEYARVGAGKLMIIGDGRDRAQLEKMAHSLKIEESVEFFGALFGSEKDAVLKGVDVFLHPSRNEGMPGAVLEAAGMGIPVIVSEATNLAVAVRRAGAGIALPENTPQALARALREANQARQTREWSQWSQNARRMVATTFSWKRIADLHQQMYCA